MVQIKRSLSATPSNLNSPSPPPSSKTKKVKSSPKKPSSKSPTEPAKKKKTKAADGEAVEADEGSKKSGSWTGQELVLLFSIMCPKRTGVNWKEVSDQIEGRDVKSCRNKWDRIQGKIQQAIEQLGD